MGSFENLWPLPGPVVAALIAGFISFVVTVLAKDQKTSEFRQAWIDGLRADTAEFAGTAFAMVSVLKLKQHLGDDTNRYAAERHDDFAKMESLLTRISLRLNPKEHVKLMALLKEFPDEIDGTPDDHNKAVAEIVSAIHVELGLEWRRVKKGEPSFRVLKWLSFCTLIAGAVVGAIIIYHHLLFK